VQRLRAQPFQSGRMSSCNIPQEHSVSESVQRLKPQTLYQIFVVALVYARISTLGSPARVYSWTSITDCSAYLVNVRWLLLSHGCIAIPWHSSVCNVPVVYPVGSVSRHYQLWLRRNNCKDLFTHCTLLGSSEHDPGLAREGRYRVSNVITNESVCKVLYKD
jgi:hypothetical protein